MNQLVNFHLQQHINQGWGQVQYLYLSTYLSVFDVLEYLVYGNVKVLVLGTWQVIFKYYLLKSVNIAKYLNTLLYLYTWYQLQIAL